MKRQIRAIGLFSGGLDSILATKLLLMQDIDVVPLTFVTPFCPSPWGNKKRNIFNHKELGIKINIFTMGE